ncbi:hypothetical protein [Blastococcus colisei]|nr:hypothetical protein [Blastococcus colisei]
MTSTTTGLPDRYRPLDQIGADEPTPTGVIQCWRAKDRVLNRDVAIRVHTPAGQAAHAWISRALTAGGLATPALAMVYDASEGIGGGPGGDTVGGGAAGSAAYVVNEWIDGETLAERLTRGPMPDREVRTVLRRLAEGVAEAHRVGLAVGGLTPDNVVLRPNGLVGLRAVPAATGTIDGDIAALGALLEACLTGLDPAQPGQRRLTGPSDLVALVRRARSTEPGQGLSSVAAMASLLAERSRSGPMSAAARAEETDSGWLRRLRDRRPDQASDHPDAPARPQVAPDGEPVRLNPQTLPPVPPVRPVTGTAVPPGALGGDTIAAGSVTPAAGAYAGSAFPSPPTRFDDEPLDVLDDGYDGYDGRYEEPLTGENDIDEDGATRHRLVVFGLPLLALLVVVALAWWFGKGVISVAGEVDETPGSTPSVSAPAQGSETGSPVEAGAAVPIVGGDVFDPQGDGDPDHPDDVPLAFDGDPATSWSTYEYRGSPAFGNLKDGVGLLLDLGSAQELGAVTVTSTSPGATVEIRTADSAGGSVDAFDVAAAGELQEETQLVFEEPVTGQYVLVWFTGLVPSEGGFSADIAEVTVQAAG